MGKEKCSFLLTRLCQTAQVYYSIALQSFTGTADSSSMAIVSYLGLGPNWLGALGVVLALAFQPKKDLRFEGDKLIYRS